MKNAASKLGGVLGIVYCLAGFVLIFLGWNGTASKDRVPSQIPYVVSGGLAGLALVVLGSSLMLSDSLRRDRSRLAEAIDMLRGERGRGEAVALTEGADTDVVYAGATSFHRVGCRLTEGQTGLDSMTRAEALAAGREPCRICVP